ncbi:MAG: hypothetical protein JST37_07085 [Bacteroidetes bacterium]|nr:hypothetical protein [Bacteroidota bacterium]MBS1950756.1 hypothetical protein [Bacteroidota bacterium]MBS1980685.1 hypothetical protein [Bacteroidota bacterium]
MKTLRTILTGLLAIFVLASSISHSVSLHICGGEIENIAFFGKARSCEMRDSACDHSRNASHSSISHKGCCEDATLLIGSDKYASKIAEKVIVKDSQYISLPLVKIVDDMNACADLARVQFVNYKPPLIERDITILVQSFLI